MTTTAVYLVCTKCGQEKPESAFHVNRARPSGRQPRCKCCLSKRTKPLKRDATEKKCWVCKQTKLVGEFNKNRWKCDGYASECRECNKQKLREYLRRPGVAERARQRSTKHYRQGRGRLLYLERTYGISDIDYDLMKQKQGGRCALCQREIELVVDHCHETGRVRGLLCNCCNRALGQLGDSLASIKRVAEYLGG